MGGGVSSGDYSKIQYITIGSTGDATDFGDLSANKYAPMATATRDGA